MKETERQREETAAAPPQAPDAGDGRPDLGNSTPAYRVSPAKSPDPVENAKFRYALIAPVITNTHPDGTAHAYFIRISGKEVLFPDGRMRRVCVSTLEKWLHIYRTAGLDGLVRSVRSDKGCPRALSDGALEALAELVHSYPRLPCPGLREKMVCMGVIDASVSVRCIQRAVKEKGLRTAVNPQVKDRKAYEAEFFGCIWQCDTCYTDYITENGETQRTYLIIIIDDHSRMLLAGEFFYHDNAENFQKVLRRAVEVYGVPDILYSDHGSSFENTQVELITASIGTVHRLAPVRDGAAKGKVERTFKTIKERWLYGLDIDGINSIGGLNAEFMGYVHRHNTTVNRATGETPLARYLRTGNHIRPVKSMEWVAECFKFRITRKVRRDSTVSIDSVFYDCPPEFIGKKVEIRYVPGDMSTAYIYSGGKHHPVKRTDRVVNGKAKRNNTYKKLEYSYSEGMEQKGGAE